MDTAQQRRIIATSAILVMATGYIAAIQKGRLIPTSRFLIGYGFAFLITSVMADLGSPLGASMALIIMVATILENADLILAWTGDRAKGKAPKVAATTYNSLDPFSGGLQPVERTMTD